MILESTANAYEGLCARCNKGGGKCESCGVQLSQPNKMGKYFCMECERAARLSGLSFLPKGWNKLSDVDWGVIANNYVLLNNDLLRLFRDVQADDSVYGIVFQLSQNYVLDIHINTRDGVDEIPERMRKIANWGKELNDEEWIRKVGIWYTPAWKYAELGCVFESNFRAINDFHYDLFEKLSDLSEESDDWEQLHQRIDEARLSAIETIRDSEAFTGILKASDVAVHIVDDDGLDYHTKTRIGG